MPTITEIEDLKRIYKRRVPKMFYDYCESGSWTEQTFRDNVSDFNELRLRQRVAVDMTGRKTATQMIGQDVSMPVALAPVGLTGMQHADGEIHAARAAGKFGVPYCLSTMSICSIEDVAENTDAPFWLQVYTLKDDDFMQRLFDRAKAAKCSAAVITVDLQLLGQRHKDIKNGLSAPPKLTPKSVANMMTKVPWGLEMLQTKRRFFGNIVGHAKGVDDPSSLSTWTAESFDQALDWDRIRQFRKMWDGPLIIKGIMDPRDALEACNVGADAIVVSNHGGRQLDGALSSIRALAPIMDAVGDRIEVHLDSGVRSGQDVLKAVAMGAKGCWIGRAYIYGLGAMGETGVSEALRVIHKELDTSMALCGRTDIETVDRDILMIPKGFSGDWEN
ncbi:MAG: alpha-hydroxy-acid oxidizing protein [Rhodobacteraceae bacterium]|jgi:L-lactate dehydrogenase (cytochrome)|uniref:L-lactate dehydrogenase (Cytochrome) n=1 Tax=Salipiger profundus TaxID=1229727 RepID=A0A1U7DAR1_9RHOB|nr:MULTISPECIES: alpha-hydroxy acid oxidase [Salipiger]APX25150.1 L-lactate dehydrogenase (cytochrome) [Salipiger profundus]MAB05490.1 alpha-hydroxy-acid oxidizing protein [Paracoccaceae bacterium]GGA15673.1 alpha-hydroxy-acid oxidizing enzyme [Salipiger profundus]SFD09592.1 L-lactate dehydrogenase (cytochrome) [Salipiger profundus]